MLLRWRIMASMVFVILLTVAVTVVLGYCTSQSRLGVFVDELGDRQASRLAQDLSREFTTAGGWQTVDRPLSEAGYIYECRVCRENDLKNMRKSPSSSSTEIPYELSSSVSMGAW